MTHLSKHVLVAASVVVLSVVAASATEKASADGFPAKSASGRVLNLDFETGDLTDWTAEGNAFDGQPVQGDTIHARSPDSVSGHKGQYWIGTRERAGDGPLGTLTSVRFPVAHPYASFLVGGGSGGALAVEVVRADTDVVIFRASGRRLEEMRPVVVNLNELVGKTIYLRIIDRAFTGFAHINFDHFRFHDEKPVFDAVRKSVVRESDEYPHAGLLAEEAVRVMKLPEGFNAIAFAAEPDVKQPIAMALDDRGRLWIAEAYEYPVRAPEGQGRDRILIFEDSDNDGKFDKRKQFASGLNLVSGMEVGFGGVWVGASPYLMFIPDRDGDDVADGEPEILLDGWAREDTHETLNSFIWGPDGWLYGCHGVFTHSLVGKPGTPVSERTPLNAGIWRFHPTRHIFQVFAEGTSNPWGVDFNDHGQAFCTACVIPHLFHVIQGARYQRQAGSHFNPHSYDDIRTIADHLHYLGEHSHARNDSSGDAGGGHAHAGAMVYLGDAWPDEYRGRIFMNNIHGQRVNTDILKPSGSGFVGSHGPDFLLTGDLASQILNLRYGPDGNAFVIDWYDTNACHHHNVEGHDRTNGRVLKVVYGDPKTKSVNLNERSEVELAELVLHKNDWYVRHARRILQERAAAGKIASAGKNLDAARLRLIEIATTHTDGTRRLRAAWALHVSGGVPAKITSELLEDEDEYVRGWGIQLALDSDQLPANDVIARFATMARDDTSQVVRLYLASALQRLPLDRRWTILDGLVSHREDAGDHNLPLMYWYASEPLAEVDPDRALTFGLSCGKTIPQLREFMFRRVGEIDSESSLVVLVDVLGKSLDAEEQLVILQNIRRALSGKRRVEAPGNWKRIYDELGQSGSESVRTQAMALGVTFGDRSAFDSLRALVSARDADQGRRRAALETLLGAKDSQLVATLYDLLYDSAMRDLALKGLAQYDDPRTAASVLAIYAELPPSERLAALATLASRASYAIALLEAIDAKKVSASDLTADLVRQMHNLNNDRVDELIANVWGTVRSTAADKAELIAQYRKLIESPPTDVRIDAELGRAIFAKTCQQCHTLYGTGHDIGPDLTGSNRADIDYLLTNIVDPNAVMAKEYQPSVIITADGRVVTGIVSAKDDKSLTIRTATETLIIPHDEIDEVTLSSTSMMPDDQLRQFSQQEMLSLFAYLRGKAQLPMLATKENAALLFNGRDLAGWRGDTQFWSVENGEIVGRSPGLDHHSFLISDLAAEDFRLTFEVKLVQNQGNSGVQFRSQPLDGFERFQGYQADIGPGWWGKLNKEGGRKKLWEKPGEVHVKKGDWNQYVIEARGNRLRTWINGNPCVDLDDPQGNRRGVFALQIHSGSKTEIRFRNLKLEVFDIDK